MPSSTIARIGNTGCGEVVVVSWNNVRLGVDEHVGPQRGPLSSPIYIQGPFYGSRFGVVDSYNRQEKALGCFCCMCSRKNTNTRAGLQVGQSKSKSTIECNIQKKGGKLLNKRDTIRVASDK